MSTISQLVSSAAKLSVSPQGYHPLDPINAAEIAGAVYAIKSYIAQNEKSNGYRLWFKSIQLIDPPKKVLAPYLDAWHEARSRGQTVDKLPRRAEALLGVKRKDGTCTWYGE